LFPILGGRLLKSQPIGRRHALPIVSNPWREAIEEISPNHGDCGDKVSNPWREAIEEAAGKLSQFIKEKFPILGGRLLKADCLLYLSG